MNVESFFDDPDKRLKLIEVARSWLRTPFVAHARSKQAGVDCVNLAAELYRESGFDHSVTFPRYTVDHGVHSGDSRLDRTIESSQKFVRVACYGNADFRDLTILKPGDLVTLKLGRVAHHCGVVVMSTNFLHVYEGQPVHWSDLREATWLSRWVSAYRPKPGGKSNVV